MLVSLVGLLGLGWYLAGSLGLVTVGSSSLPPGARQSSSTRDAFEELYQLGWRADGSAGNTAVEVVYYFPALVQALSAYAERSLTQAQTLQELQPNDDALLHPFLVRLERNTALDSAWPVQERIRLVDDGGQPYAVERWRAFADPSGSANVLLGVAWFRQPESASPPDRLTLTLEAVPGNAQSTTLTWNSQVLRGIELAT
jgi:hypothetical protein